MLDNGFIELDRSPFDMVLCYIMPVMASKSFREIVENGEHYLPVHIACYSKSLFENGLINENQFKLLTHIVDLNIYSRAGEDVIVDDNFTLAELTKHNIGLNYINGVNANLSADF